MDLIGGTATFQTHLAILNDGILPNMRLFNLVLLKSCKLLGKVCQKVLQSHHDFISKLYIRICYNTAFLDAVYGIQAN